MLPQFGCIHHRKCLYLLLSYCTIAVHCLKKPFYDDTLYFDKTIPDYETILTPSDYEMGTHISEVLQFNGEREVDIWDSDAMYSEDKFEGDISNDLNASTVGMFLRGAPDNGFDNNNFGNAIRNRLQLWQNNKIPYAISSQYSSYSRSIIASSMEEYNKHTCVQWVPKSNSDTNYVYIMPERGCYSMVGKTGGRQTLSLGNGCIQKGIIIHEMMHAVGFFHEQSRTDRDEFITIMWNNIQPGMQGQFEKYSQSTIQYLGTEYDYTSIMHYGPKAFSRNGLPTIVPKKHVTIGQRSGFSKVDAFKINALYGCSTNAKPPPPPVDGTVGPTGSTTPPVVTAKPQPSGGSSTAKVIIPLKPKPTGTTTSKPYPSPPTLPTLRPRPNIASSTIPPPPVIPECKNTRPDCDQLAQQGWCHRNPHWMKDNCPISCGFCKPAPECEDLRVDCPELTKKRYCILAPNYMRSYCAKSCGFCTVAPVTEVPDTSPVTRKIETAYTKSTVQPSVFTRGPFVTFWPTIMPIIDNSRTTQSPTAKTEPPATPFPCRDLKHFCPQWKNAGFCEGIFYSYMKKNCPASCGHC